jgi:hypothetical protein
MLAGSLTRTSSFIRPWHSGAGEDVHGEGTRKSSAHGRQPPSFLAAIVPACSYPRMWTTARSTQASAYFGSRASTPSGSSCAWCRFSSLAFFRRWHPEWPWAAATTGCLLILMLVWLSGRGWPRSTAVFRRFHLRLWRPGDMVWRQPGHDSGLDLRWSGSMRCMCSWEPRARRRTSVSMRRPRFASPSC